jgi:phage tail-like protein
MPVVPDGVPDPNSDGMPENPYRQLNFTVEVDEVEVGGFQEISGLAVQVETETYREGGRNESVHQLPGQVNHDNLVLKRGLTNRRVLWDWTRDVRSSSVQNDEIQRNVRVMLRGGYKSDRMWGWEFRNAYPVRWDGPDLVSDGSGTSVAVQSIEFAHDGFDTLEGMP